MASIENIINLKVRQLEKDIEDSANKSIAPLMDFEYREAIMDTVYLPAEGDSYNRSMGLLNSSTTSVEKTGSGFLISVFNDSSIMNWSPYEEHSSWITGGDNRNDIAKWMALGHHGIVNYTPANFHILTYQRLLREKQYLKSIKRDLKLKGYRVK